MIPVDKTSSTNSEQAEEPSNESATAEDLVVDPVVALVDLESDEEDVDADDADAAPELDLTPGEPDKSTDPVRTYLREMGASPLLTREGEVEIAKRIERGRRRVLRAVSRCPITVLELKSIPTRLENRDVLIRELVSVEEMSEEHTTARIKFVLDGLSEIERLERARDKIEEKLRLAAGSRKGAANKKLRYQYARIHVKISQVIRRLDLTKLGSRESSL